jgi:Na+-transporting methylmalonyl-CoA/oxaloacetate decarboxylase gamma subunit
MFIYEGIGGVVLFLAMSVLAIYFYGRLCRDAGYEEGRGDRHEEQLAEDRAERAARAGRHRKGQPRTAAAPPPGTEDKPARVPLRATLVQDWYRAVDIYNGKRAAKGLPPVDERGRAIGTVTSIDTVLLAPEPAPHLNGAADTGTMTRIHLDAGTTGEIRAVGDELVAKIERGELV